MGLFENLQPFRRQDTLRDARAGVTLAAMNIPQVLGYTRIAGMPVVTGLYTLLLPVAAFAAFGSSRYLVVAADSATAAILASGLTGMAPMASPAWVCLAGYVALLTGLFLLLGRLLRLGFIADFLSQTVLVGFLTGVGFQVGVAVMGETLGLPIQSRRTIGQAVEIVRGLPMLHLPVLLVSGSVLVLVLALRYLAPKVPGPLVGVVSVTAASALWHFSAHGIPTIGAVAGGLPHPSLHLLPWRQILALVPVAGSCAIMIVTQSAATARVYALRHDQKLDENRDLLGLSAANVAAALTGSFVVNGSPTQTAMVETAGGRSQKAQLATAAVVVCVLLVSHSPASVSAPVRARRAGAAGCHSPHRRARIAGHAAGKSRRVYRGPLDRHHRGGGRRGSGHPAGHGAVSGAHCASQLPSPYRRDSVRK